MGIFKISRQSIAIKALFFLSYFAAATWLIYFYVYLKEFPKLSGVEIGIIAMFQQFNNVFVLPVWGFWADRYGRKRVLLFSLGFTVLLLPLFVLFKSALFITLFLVAITLVYNPLMSLLDTIALDYQAESEGKTSYGQSRLWASIGWASASLITGLFINQSNMGIIFPLSASLFLITWLILFFVYKPLKNTQNIKELKRGVFINLLKNEPKLLLFLVVVFIYCIFSAPIYLMINMYYFELGASNQIIGWAYFIQSVCELPFFFYGKKFIDKYGAQKIFIFTMIATGIRMLAYGLISDPVLALGVGVIHGISIGFFYVSATSFVHSIVPPQLRSSGQAIFNTFYAVGVALGNVLTGFSDDYLSVKKTMFFDGIGIFVLVGFIFIGLNFFKKYWPNVGLRVKS